MGVVEKQEKTRCKNIDIFAMPPRLSKSESADSKKAEKCGGSALLIQIVTHPITFCSNWPGLLSSCSLFLTVNMIVFLSSAVSFFDACGWVVQHYDLEKFKEPEERTESAFKRATACAFLLPVNFYKCKNYLNMKLICSKIFLQIKTNYVCLLVTKHTD